jgi:hypothetical protein
MTMTSVASNLSLVEEFLPVYDVSDSVAVVVSADVETTWRALLEADLMEVGRRRPLAAALGALRGLPDIVTRLLRGEPIPKMPEHLRLRDMTGMPVDRGGWVLLGERPADEIALGLVGKFWLPVIPFVAVGAPEFRDYAEAGYAKTVYALSVRRLDAGRTLLSAVTRTATTDDSSRVSFRRYWTFGVGSGAHVLVNGLLDLIKEAAERKD